MSEQAMTGTQPPIALSAASGVPLHQPRRKMT
jgi:hypothetical protein